MTRGDLTIGELSSRLAIHKRPGRPPLSPVRVTDGLAELVCSNAFRSDEAEHNAGGQSSALFPGETPRRE